MPPLTTCLEYAGLIVGLAYVLPALLLWLLNQ